MDVEDKPIDTTVNVPPLKSGGRLSVNDLMGMEAPFLRKKAELSSEATKAKGEELQAKQAQSETEATGVSAAFQKGAEQERQAREKYKADIAANPLPAFVPSKEDAGDMGLLFTLTNILGFAVGAKGHAQASLSAMNGMLEGHQKGREDLYKREKDEFDKNFKVLIEKQKTLRQEMEDAIKLSATDREAGQQAAHLAAVRSGSDVVKAQVAQGRLVDAYKQVEDNQKIAEKALDIVEKQRKKDLEYGRQKELKQMEITATKLKENNKTAVPMIQGIRGIERLQEQLRDPEIRTGLLAKTAPWMEKLKSISKAGDNEDFESVVNRTLTGDDKTTLFLKDALLESYAIERAANAGQRVTVQMMKQAGPVLDPTNYTPQTYNALLDTRRKVLYDNLQDMGYSPEQIKKSSAAHEYTPYGGQPQSALKEVKTQAEFDALPSGSEYLEDGKKYRKP